MDAAASGDRDARQALFERHRDAAYRVALRITGRDEDALDVVQDAFIKAFGRLDGFRGRAVGLEPAPGSATVSSDASPAEMPVSSFKTWLLRIVTNRALDALRARKVRLAVSIDGFDENGALDVVPAAREDPPGSDVERRELADVLQRAIEALPPDQKSVFSLYASGDLTYGQIAEVVGIPVGTVMSRIFHARRRLHERLADFAPIARRASSD